ncbi:MAG: MinD/ParA family protein [Desulfobulbaceae bacterium]|nr:MinD/ParA family protein [Desulfobulbaceae bacterium]HIJ79668.1 MinD/ParA family protein [Deltaproteobacteria bacterium]
MIATSYHNPKIICISSGKGGVGKTSFTVNLATALSDKGKQVLLIDGDLGLANVDVVLGLNVRHTIRETIEEGRDLLASLVEINPGFMVLPASSGVPEMANLSLEEQAFLTSSLEEIIDRFDYVLIDTAAGIGDSVMWFNTWAHENIVIITPDPTSLTDAYALMKVLHSRHGRNHFHLMINSVKSKKEGQEVFANMSLVLERFLKITPRQIGAMHQDSSVSNAIRQQKPFFLAAPESRASKEIDAVADRILAF